MLPATHRRLHQEATPLPQVAICSPQQATAQRQYQVAIPLSLPQISMEDFPVASTQLQHPLATDLQGSMGLLMEVSMEPLWLP